MLGTVSSISTPKEQLFGEITLAIANVDNCSSKKITTVNE